MSPSVGTKSRKKHTASAEALDTTLNGHTVNIPSTDQQMAQSRELEQALLALEGCCMRVLVATETINPQDTDSRYWHQRFENIVSPISLALAECKGPRKFHYHYRRREDDEAVLHPVMENALDTLARVCDEALHHCQDDLSGMHENDINSLKHELGRCIRHFLDAKKKLF